MKKLLTAMLLFALLLSGCGAGGEEGPAAPAELMESPLSASGSEEPSPTELPFTAQYIRTNGYVEGAQYPRSCVIGSRSQLTAYCEANKDLYDLERREQASSDSTIGFLDAVERYDDSFFEKSSLIVILLEESSGSTRHEVTGVECAPELYTVNIHRVEPEMGTCDMAQWHILIEIPVDSKTPGAPYQAEVRLDGSPSAEDLREDRCGLYLQVLEDLWEVDPGLNGGISILGMDLSALTHLNNKERAYVEETFADKHNLPYVTGTWAELCDQGYIDRDNLYWEDGLFFCIKTNEDAEWSLSAVKEGDQPPELTAFDAHKWRSGLGAYFFGNCSAWKNEDGTWTYSVGQEAIS